LKRREKAQERENTKDDEHGVQVERQNPENYNTITMVNSEGNPETKIFYYEGEQAVKLWEEQEKEFQHQIQKLENSIKKKEEENTEVDSRKHGLNCTFFLKTGSCRYGETCNKRHPYPSISNTLILKNMYDGPGMSEPTDEDNDDLEFSEEEIREHFEQFWYDIVPEFKTYGEIEQIFICRNHSYHLRGNVYLTYKKKEDAATAYQVLNDRYYASKKLVVHYSPVDNLKSAVCGLFTRRKCERGKNCNFLHIFPNPNGELEGRQERDNDNNRHRNRYRYRDRERERDRNRENFRDRYRERRRPRSRDRPRTRDRESDTDEEYPKNDKDRNHRDKRHKKDRPRRDRSKDRKRDKD